MIDMKHLFTTALFSLAVLSALAQSTETLLLEGWKFQRGTSEGAQVASYNDSHWQPVTIPHDWSIAGPFDKDIDKQVVTITQNGEREATEKTGRSGALPWVGEGWYRTTITIPEGYSHGELIFDGAMSEPHVWVNGQDVGYWAYGYNVFSLDISRATGGCKPGQYAVAVQVKNIEESTRWYPGAGIYRPVRLLLHKDNYLKSWGIFARTTMINGISVDATTATEARVHVSAEAITAQKQGLSVKHILKDTQDRVVAQGEARLYTSSESDVVLHVKDASLWSPEHPTLYTLVTELKEGDKLWDRRETHIGIRDLEYTADGFKLNGQIRKIKGVCLHHDLGPLGTAFNKAAFRRQIRLLKEMGCDAIRTAHNTPAPWQMDICDGMGVMVMAESFDMWIHPKCKNGYSRFFDKVDSTHANSDGRAWWERDLTNLVLVNRNHPSIIMYSIGNEIPEQGNAIGLKYSRLMQNLIHRLDPTRLCTQGMEHAARAMHCGVWQEMDIPGVDYHLFDYAEGLRLSPKGFLLGTETTSTISSRGVYKFPVEETYETEYPDGQLSSYDLEACNWSNLPDDDWMWQDKCPAVIGEFVWTGFDYLGEPTPYDEYWPSRSSYFGIHDLAGLPKDRAWLYRSRWNTEKSTLHVLPHWTWKGREGETTPVFVYTSYPEAELFINGKSQGRKKKIDVPMENYLTYRVDRTMPWGDTSSFPDPNTPEGMNRLDRHRLRWMDVVYEPGEIKVVAFDAEGREAETQIIRTAGKPHHLELVTDRTQLTATPVDTEGRATDTPDLAFVTVRVVDKDGNLCPDADPQLFFEVNGAGRFNSCCNGDATSTEVFVKPTMRAFHGELVVVVEATKKAGTATLTVSGKGLRKGSVQLHIDSKK